MIRVLVPAPRRHVRKNCRHSDGSYGHSKQAEGDEHAADQAHGCFGSLDVTNSVSPRGREGGVMPPVDLEELGAWCPCLAEWRTTRDMANITPALDALMRALDREERAG